MKSYWHHYKNNFRIAYPVALSQLGHIAVGVADTVMVGKLGGTALASATLAFSVSIPFMMFGIGVSYGVSPLIAKADGENNTEEIGKVFHQSVVLNTAIGILLFLFLFFAAPLLGKLDQQPQVVEKAVPFFRILAVSIVPLMVFQAMKQFAEGLAITRPTMYVSVAGNVINIAINYLLISGNAGFPALGVDGAGYATLTARVLMALAMIVFVFTHKRFRIYRRATVRSSFSFREYFHIVKMSLPVGVQLILEAGAFGFAAVMVGWLGDGEIAAHQIALNMAAVTYMAATGISAAATVVVGNEYGKKDYREMRRAGFSSFHLVLVFMGCCAVGFLLFRHSLPHFYIAERHIAHMATSLLLITAFFQLSDGLQVVALGALRGLGDVRVPTIVAMIAYWLVGLPFGYVLAFNCRLGVEGVWYGLLTGLTLAAIMLSVRFALKSRC